MIKRTFSVPAAQHGAGPVRFTWQRAQGNFVASSGRSNTVVVTNRLGQPVGSSQLEGACAALEWAPDGSKLAVVSEKSSAVVVWDSATQAFAQPLDTGMKGVCELAWSASSARLAVGTSKGNVLIYDFDASRKIPILGKHTKAIVCAAWSPDDVLALASDDRTFTLSNAHGDTMYQMALKGEPSLLKWGKVKNKNDNGKLDTVLSVALACKTLLVHNTAAPDQPVELAFQQKYGSIVDYEWYGAGLLMIAFSNGYCIVISTNPKELGQELFQIRDQKDTLEAFVISTELGQVALCGHSSVKIHDLSDIKDVVAVITVDEEQGKLDSVDWTDDGQFLTIGSKSGNVHTYLAKLPQIGTALGSTVCFVSSIREVSISDQSRITSDTLVLDAQQNLVLKKQVEIEPTALALGPGHMAVAFNNTVWFYELSHSNGHYALSDSPVGKKEFLSTVKSIHVSPAFVGALLINGELVIESLESITTTPGALPRRIKFPTQSFLGKLSTGQAANFRITSVHISADFVVYSTSAGQIHHFSVGDWCLLNEYQHAKEITGVYPKPDNPSKCAFRDAANELFILDAIQSTALKVAASGKKIRDVVWDSARNNRYVFTTVEDQTVSTFAFAPQTIKGPLCLAVGSTRLPMGLKPLCLKDGIMTCQTPTGRLSAVLLATHDKLAVEPSKSDVQVGKAMQIRYSIGRMSDIWALVGVVEDRRAWNMLAEAALHVTDIATAKRVYQQILGDAGMVMTLQYLETVEDRSLLNGNIALLYGDYKLAQEYFLASSNPLAALDLKRDLLQFDQALSLAEKIAPGQVASIAKDYAQHLEYNERFVEAFSMYELALSAAESGAAAENLDTEHTSICKTGHIRMAFQTGNLALGMKLITQSPNTDLQQTCAAILDGTKQYYEAGVLYERARLFDRAAESYMKGRHYAKIGEIVRQIKSPSIFAQYAKVCEAEGNFAQAAVAYESAMDYESVVRLYIDKLHKIDDAITVARKTRSKESAKLISDFFQSIKDYRSVVEFCLIAGLIEDAFELAKTHNEVEFFAEIVKDEAPADMLVKISTYFENKCSFLLAGKYLQLAGDYASSLKMFIRGSATDLKAIDGAIQTVGLAKSDPLTHQLIDFLMGEVDGVPKDAKYIFNLYMSLGQYKDAARTAIIIAREEQGMGNYRAAHSLLFENYTQLRKTGTKIPLDLERIFMLLHSYILVKLLIKMDEHDKAARMLIRVSNNLSKFPAHVVPILTSAVIECYRSGLKVSAFEFAAMLMRPENRAKIDPKLKRKIEQIVRRPEKEEVEEPMSECPFCRTLLPDSALDCKECKNHIPFCIATGLHIVAGDSTTCPHCAFPARQGFFRKMVAELKCCPMCSNKVSLDQLSDAKDAHKDTAFEAGVLPDANATSKSPADGESLARSESVLPTAIDDTAAGGRGSVGVVSGSIGGLVS